MCSEKRKAIISVIAPMYNEEPLVSEYCSQVLHVAQTLRERCDFEIVLVNDGSRDHTYERMLEQQQKYPEEITTICLSRNFGLEGAVHAGLQKAVGDAVIVMDADLQDPPELIPQMIQKWEQGADVVTARRMARSSDGLFKKASAGLYYQILEKLSGKLKLERNAANFRLLSRRALENLLHLPEVNRVFRVEVPFIGMKTDTVAYDRNRRYAGKTKYRLSNMIPYALDSLTGISTVPLHAAGYMLPLFALLFVVCMIALFMLHGIWRAAFFLAALMLFCTGVLTAAIAVLSVYAAHILAEVKGRPISIIDSYMPSGNSKRRNVE